MKRSVLFLASLATAAPALAADQFDLICTSSYHDATFHYRVDLTANQWCVTQDQGRRLTDIGSTCPTYPIASVSSDTILFSSYPIQLAARDSGKWAYGATGSGVEYRGTCAPAPFSGFPKLETKF